MDLTKHVAARLREIQTRLGSVVRPLEVSDWVAKIKRDSGRAISTKSMRRYLAGERLPDLNQIAAIVKTAPGYTPEWVAYGVNPPSVAREPQAGKPGQTDGTLEMPPARTKKDDATSAGPKRVG